MNDILKQEESWLLKEKYKGEKKPAFFADLEELKKGIPLAYIIGNMPFLDTVIDLEYKPLIPRSETEFWVNDFINEIKLKKQDVDGFQILDIFSGSGCIGIGILKNLTNTKVDFSEINENYIKQIEKNLLLNNINNLRYNIFQSNIFNNIDKDLKYDVILANPPYISKDRKNEVQESVLMNEDHDALFVQDNGLYFLKQIIIEGKKFLKKNGQIWIEFDPWQVDLINIFLKKEDIENYVFWKDQYKKNRVLIVTIS